MGFEQCQADPCVFRRVLRGNVVIIVVYIDDLLVASETKHGEERLVESLTLPRGAACDLELAPSSPLTDYNMAC